MFESIEYTKSLFNDNDDTWDQRGDNIKGKSKTFKSDSMLT